jgi:hypothetical protein
MIPFAQRPFAPVLAALRRVRLPPPPLAPLHYLLVVARDGRCSRRHFLLAAHDQFESGKKATNASLSRSFDADWSGCRQLVINRYSLRGMTPLRDSMTCLASPSLLYCGNTVSAIALAISARTARVKLGLQFSFFPPDCGCHFLPHTHGQGFGIDLQFGLVA